MDITLKPIKSALLTIDSVERTVHRIGQGRYCTAWKNGTGQVWLQVNEKDFSKEILAHLTESLPHNPHLPKVKYVGDFSVYRLYQSPQYFPLTAKSKDAWNMFKALSSAWNTVKFVSHFPPRSAYDDAAAIKDKFCAKVAELFPDSPIYEAVDALVTQSYNYGAYTIEVTKKNSAVDAVGNLVLLDPLFDLQEIRDAMNKKWRF
jgi:hypothetical protein